jgi:hypothetical protein
MGQEATCRVDLGRQSSAGKALLETNEIIFRGDFRLKIAYRDIQKVHAKDGKLIVVAPEGTAVFHLGDSAFKWASKILHPPSRLDKLGVKPGTKVRVIGQLDDDFLQEIEQRSALVVRSGADLVFLAAEKRSDLVKLSKITSSPIWVVYPKGIKPITENDVRAAGLGAGLVDIKVASFSPTHTALKFTQRIG